MPPVIAPRPTLRSFRVLKMSCHNQGDVVGDNLRMDVDQNISLGIAVPSVAGAPLMVTVSIKLQGKVVDDKASTDSPMCACEYEGKFYYPDDVTEEVVTNLLDERDYQYVLVAQAFPLAMTHFRRELQAVGIDAREMPLGLEYN